MNKIKHLKVLEFEQTFGTIEMPMIAMFNSSRIREDAVRELVINGTVEHNDFIVVMFKSQYENLKDLIKPNVNKEKDFYEDLKLEQQGGII